MGGPHGRRITTAAQREAAQRRAAPQPSAHQLRLDDLGTPLIDVAFVVVDLETTGVDPAHDRITEVGAVRSRRGEVEAELATMIDPQRPVPPAITAITGITDAMLAGCPPITAVLPSLTELLRGGVFVAHNAAFDHRFLDAALERSGREPLDVPVLDTARLARRLLSQELRSMRLSVLARHLGARTTPNHRALPDARATLDVLHALIERAAGLGASTLEDLLDLQRSTSHRAYRRIDLVKDAPRSPGVYRFLGPDEEVLYVGTTGDLRTRLRRYFGQDRRRRIADLVNATSRVDWTVCETTIEAQVREVREIHRHRPRFNRRSRHPEKAAWVTLTEEAFPRLTVSSRPREGIPALGPLGGRKQAALVVAAIEQASEVRPCRMRLRVRQDHRPCALKELGRCAAPCDGSQSRASYADDVAPVRALLGGRDVQALRSLRQQMRAMAAGGHFERAAETRQRLHALARAIDRTRTLRRLLAVDRLVAERHGEDGVEVLEVATGRLAASHRRQAGEAHLPASPPASATPPTATDADDGPVVLDPVDVEEVLLLAGWLDQPGVVVEHASGTWADPIAGGRAVADAVTEARDLGRRLRRDRQALQREKVVRAS